VLTVSVTDPPIAVLKCVCVCVHVCMYVCMFVFTELQRRYVAHVTIYVYACVCVYLYSESH
jgi:hypothetical protein